VDGVQREFRLVPRVKHFQSAEHNPPVRQQRRFVVAADVGCDRVDVAAIGVHHVQRRARIAVVFVPDSDRGWSERDPPVG